MAAATPSAGWISISKNNAEACPAAADGTAVSTDHATASTLTGETLRRWCLVYFLGDLVLVVCWETST